MNQNSSFSKLCLLLWIVFPSTGFSQASQEFISNPSFEGEPQKGLYWNDSNSNKFLEPWTDCGKSLFPHESRPDIFPINERIPKIEASNGNTYVALVVRDNCSWEEISQKLMHTLEEGHCYSFTIDLAKANPYLAASRFKEPKPEYNYNKSVNLRIWGGIDYCEEFELLYVSPPVDNEEWQSYEVNIHPESDITHISLQAYYIDESEPYNGNILIDNISQFIIVDCNE